MTTPLRAETSATAEARRHFDAGVVLLDDPDGPRYEEAYAEFKAAWDVSRSPRVLGNLGLAAMKLERDGEAIDAYVTYLREAPGIDAEERAQIVRDLQTLQVTVARVAISGLPRGATVMDERMPVTGSPIVNRYTAEGSALELGVRPGHHRITVTAAGKRPFVLELTARPGAKDDVAVKLTAEPLANDEPGGPSSGGPSAVPLALLIGGASALVAGGVTGAVALTKSHTIDTQCPAPTYACAPGFDLERARGDAKPFVVATDILLVSGAALVATGALFWWLEPSSPRTSAFCGPSGCAANVAVTF